MRFVLAALVAAFSFPAFADHQVCRPHEMLVEFLESSYGEVVVGRGLLGDTHIIEMFVSPDGGMTVIATTKDGVACVIASANDWEAVAPKAPGRGS